MAICLPSLLICETAFDAGVLQHITDGAREYRPLLISTTDLDLGYKLGADPDSWTTGAPQVHRLPESSTGNTGKLLLGDTNKDAGI